MRQGVASTGARSERIRTYNYADDRVTDHRLGASVYGVGRVLEGGPLLDEIVAGLEEHARRARVDEYVASLTDADAGAARGAGGGGARG